MRLTRTRARATNLRRGRKLYPATVFDGLGMFVCNCNGVRMRDMSAAVETVVVGGAPTVAAVYEACGVAPRCGRCKVDIQRMLDAANESSCALAAE